MCGTAASGNAAASTPSAHPSSSPGRKFLRGAQRPSTMRTEGLQRAVRVEADGSAFEHAGKIEAGPFDLVAREAVRQLMAHRVLEQEDDIRCLEHVRDVIFEQLERPITAEEILCAQSPAEHRRHRDPTGTGHHVDGDAPRDMTRAIGEHAGDAHDRSLHAGDRVPAPVSNLDHEHSQG